MTKNNYQKFMNGDWVLCGDTYFKRISPEIKIALRKNSDGKWMGVLFLTGKTKLESCEWTIALPCEDITGAKKFMTRYTNLIKRKFDGIELSHAK